MFQSKTYVCAYTYIYTYVHTVHGDYNCNAIYNIRIYNLFCSILPCNCKMLFSSIPIST